jgi:hypothetical protein
MSCKHMRYIEQYLDDLTAEQMEQVKRIICSTLCNGECKNIYLEDNKNG